MVTTAYMVSTAQSGGRVLRVERQREDTRVTDNKVQHHSLAQRRPRSDLVALERKAPWSLPTMALADPLDTIKILVMRFNFQKETSDDPNTTGNGEMDLRRPLDNLTDSAAYYNEVRHWIDPPPHDSLYFDAHLKALRVYWETVSDGKITLDWDVWPPGIDSTYRLPAPMSEYGICAAGLPENQAFDTVIYGLVHYFVDCFETADAVSPEIEFSKYDSYFLFHAGSDRQNDIGFPTTCSDMFTGYINFVPDTVFFDTLYVDNDSTTIWDAMIIPETSNQDNRATALNAVLAHEFGHQLGLPDLYRTDAFITNLGDFALMDHNGFNTGVDFGWEAGNSFGTIPVFPCAWSRAYLGFVEVRDFRAGTDIYLAAAELASDSTRIARIPISENEYYLLENRVDDLYPDIETALLADSATGVIQYPVDVETREFTGEFDFLIPGNGLLIYHVDEGVAGLNYDWFTGDTVVNFEDNKLQLVPTRRFIRIVEADGVVDMSGYYETGRRRFGSAEDMFREDTKSSFTPNTNPPAIDNSGNDTHVRVERIGRVRYSVGGIPRRLDTAMTFNLETDKLVDGFPVRGGPPVLGLSPVLDDLNGDGSSEIIFASGSNLSVVTLDGQNFLHQVSQCDPCVTYDDTALASIHTGRPHPLPLFARTAENIYAGPVTGDFGFGLTEKFVAVGYPSGAAGRVAIYRPSDANNDGLADAAIPGQPDFSTSGAPLALSFGDALWVLTSDGSVYLKEDLGPTFPRVHVLDEEVFHGICRSEDLLWVLAGDSSATDATVQTRLWLMDGADSLNFALDGYYNLGPILVDVDRNGIPELAMASSDGRILLLTVHWHLGPALVFDPLTQVLASIETGYSFTTNPVAGDIDRDGYPDLVIGGANAVYAFNRNLTLLTGFPIEIDDRLQYDDVNFFGYYEDLAIAAPVIGDIQKGGSPEIIFPSFAGNVYSFGPELSYGFPMSAGERGAGSCLTFADTSSSGRLGYLGADGWFYLWETGPDIDPIHWPMGGHDPSGSFAYDSASLSAPVSLYSGLFPEERYYNYPNPVVDGSTTIRYYLGEDANAVEFTVYDLSGQEVARFDGPRNGGVDNELVWVCSDATPGVYRCLIEVDFGGTTETAFTDIAVIR
ncbi:MAG: FG-GAP-like repeat-containing protein [candidate division Zixibacteria bacterium]|nr:FG-GAP-like repeat-containing protein [candidate division Zixibacteria bacterium]MDH3936193.1 FG-GAP-like repeat-containing protein [candidate division Zixibacteria bacterium]MDH4034869.1 FG-GAP-like repeat-containing protein [candidate division Zixibacteria bacterium]